ncbi:MAG TPA: BTAD domain-containing putative transcriptional regulator [Gaiellales bacterium]|nr:BTAD domain-containing putative transcriptional regulator [Gaiellales bacterium]
MEYRVLGPIEVAAGGRRVAIGAGKQRALLALLVMNANTAVSVDRVVESLWNGNPPATATKVVQVLVSQLRKALAGDGDQHIATVGGGYMLRLEPDQIDVDWFEELLETGRTELAGGRPHDAEGTLSAALAVWRGEAYAEVAYEDFAREEIARLNERRLDAIEERFEAMLAGRRHADAVSGLEKAVARHPLRERLVALWMVALHRSGRRAEALAAYDQARRRLADELGIEPGERLQRLHAAMLEADEPESSPLELQAPPRRSAARLLAAAAALLVAAAAALFVIEHRGGGSDRIASVAADSVGLIDPSSGTVVAQYPVGQTPSMVVARGNVAWTVNADSGTVSRVGPAGRRDQAVPGAPADLQLADGFLWVSYDRLSGDKLAFGVVRLDADTLHPEGGIELHRTEPIATQPLAPLAFAGGRLWLGAPAGLLTAMDPRRMRVVRTVHIKDVARSLAADRAGLWVLLAEGTLLRADPRTGHVRQQIAINTPHALDVEAEGGIAWVSDGFTGNVWRISPGPPVEMSSVHIGDSAFRLAAARGAAWATSSADGAVVRIDAATGDPTRVLVGNAPIGVAVSSAGVWTSVGEGSATTFEAGTQSGAVPVGNCDSLVSSGGGPPDVIVAVDLALDEVDATNFTGAMARASEEDLRQHGFQAGKFRVGMQVCDDASGGDAGVWDQAKCAANAALYAGTPKVVAVLAPFNSGCTASELPILNRAHDGPLALVSPANDWVGFTRAATGNEAGEPASHYPTGIRSFLRVYPSDIAETSADARLAKSLGLRRVIVTLNPKADGWDTTVAWSFAAAARAEGLSIVGPRVLRGHIQRTIRNAIHDGADGLFLGSRLEPPEVSAIVAARHLGGASFPIMAWNSMLYDGPHWLEHTPEARGMYISGGYYTSPHAQLPQAGQRFMSAFDGTPGQSPAFAPFSAQAMDIVLAAIARSDGSRRSVLHELFATRVRNGILGSFGFQASGDMTSVPVEIYRLEPGAARPLRPYTVLRATPG